MLDNCEHLIAGAAELADRLLAGCPRLRSSPRRREALAIDGESARRPSRRWPRRRRSRCSPTAPRPRCPGFEVDDARARDLPPARRPPARARAGRRAAAHAARRASWPSGSTTASGCSPAAAAPRSRATARCAPSSTGAGSCSTSPSAARAPAVGVHRRRHGRRARPRCTATTRSTASPRWPSARCCRSSPTPSRRATGCSRRSASTGWRSSRRRASWRRPAPRTRATSPTLAARAEPKLRARRAAALVRAAGRRAREHHRRRCATSATRGDARAALRLAVTLLWFWLLSGQPAGGDDVDWSSRSPSPARPTPTTARSPRAC